jgi:DASH complex subunit DAD3
MNHSKINCDMCTVPQLAAHLDNLASAPASEILDGLRELERKTSLVFTLLKASVYSIVLQQEIDWGGQQGHHGLGEGGGYQG